MAFGVVLSSGVTEDVLVKEHYVNTRTLRMWIMWKALSNMMGVVMWSVTMATLSTSTMATLSMFQELQF